MISRKENMTKCEICGKGPQTGFNRPHSLHRTKRLFKPNIQKVGVMVKGVKVSMRLCTDCISRLKKDGKMGKSLQTASL